MSNVRNLNQQNPFWDWISSMESNAANHPFFGAYNPESYHPRTAPQEHGPSPPDAPAPPPQPEGSSPQTATNDTPPPQYNSFGPGFPFGSPRGGPHHHRGPHGHHHGRGGWGGRGGRCGMGGNRGFGGWPMGAGGNFDMSKIAEFVSQFIPEEVLAGARDGFPPKKDTSKDSSKDFTPPADIFDTEDSFVIHLSLPGAKKEDVGVNWDADKSELNIAGVIYRPGDEDFLKTLALDERQVGVFERKVKLGSKTDPAQVDADGISARMEDGVLMVTIPKLDGDIVEVKKVDIE